ncbi:MAG: DUF1592 domain-containing protein [Pirellulaceae bacterium]
MRPSLRFAIILLPLCASLHADDSAKLEAWGKHYEDEILPIVRSRCLECHQGDEPDGGFDISSFSDGNAVIKKLDVWDSVAKRIRLREMPPEGSPQLNDAQKAAFHRWVDSRPKQDHCSQLATDETQAWYRGYVMSRRLTRTEYLNAIEDVVGVVVPSHLEVPSDGSGGEGFDTNGDTLFTSAIHVEQYLAVASHVIDDALTNSPRQLGLENELSSVSNDEEAVRTFLHQFARRAWRRPVAEAEVDRLMALFRNALQSGNELTTAIGQPLKAILVSPNFLFVVDAEAEHGGVQELTPHQLAMRLSLLVWSSVPDAILLDAADANELRTDGQIVSQIRRMLADPKAQRLGENFGLQWLGLTNFLTQTRPDQELFPNYDAALAADLREEAIRTVSDVFRQDRSLLELIDSPSVIVNDRLAKHYGLDVTNINDWQAIETDDRKRGGVLTLGAVLTSASYPRRTSPVLRGRWILEQVLGSRVPPPPEGVPALEESVGEQPKTLRQRLELHRRNPDCAACHNRMDPLGFGLENFDVLGRWRDADADLPIDASGKLPSGEAFSGPEELKQVVMRRSGEFERHFVRKMLGFALGRQLNKFDDCVINDCLESLRQNDHRASLILETIATSYPFRHRYFKPAE